MTAAQIYGEVRICNYVDMVHCTALHCAVHVNTTSLIESVALTESCTGPTSKSCATDEAAAVPPYTPTIAISSSSTITTASSN